MTQAGAFQLTAPRGGRPVKPSASTLFVKISTHGPARGPTPIRSRISCWRIWHFNSRPREGADTLQITAITALNIISTHGPARGPTLLDKIKTEAQLISTHGPARGPTCIVLPSHHWCKYFNSRPREGADRQELVARLLYKNISTHGPARGPTTITSTNGTMFKFQLTAPRGGRLPLLIS